MAEKIDLEDLRKVKACEPHDFPCNRPHALNNAAGCNDCLQLVVNAVIEQCAVAADDWMKHDMEGWMVDNHPFITEAIRNLKGEVK